MMTTKEAKELTLIKWRFRHKYPTKDLPRSITQKIIGMPAECPLCALFGEADCRLRCGANVFRDWNDAFERKDWDAASYFAGEIVRVVERWEA